MEFKYKLSIIIPCYNSSNTIERLLDSIINNDLSQEEYEIIIVDDNSTDDFINLVKPYEQKANIKYCNTNTKIHCPGNSRQIGLEVSEGEWIVFSDHDDYFEPNIFQNIFNTIKENQIDTLIHTSFYGRDIRTGILSTEEYLANKNTIPWLHGKFYNHKLLKEGNINFKKNLITHEDVYFNNIIEIYLIKINKKSFLMPELFTYNWTQNEKSISHFHIGKLLFIDFYFKDFIYVNTEPYFNISNNELEDYKFNKLLSNFLLIYFFYQQGLYRLGNDYPRKNLLAISNFKNKFLKVFQMTDQDMIDYLYSDADFYYQLKGSSFTNMDVPFIEQQSLRDFIINL